MHGHGIPSTMRVTCQPARCSRRYQAPAQRQPCAGHVREIERAARLLRAYGACARNRMRSPSTATWTSQRPADASRPGSVSESTGTKMSSEWRSRRSGVSSPSVPTNRPPGRRIRLASMNSRSWPAAVGMWCSIVKHVTAVNACDGSPDWVASAQTTVTLSPSRAAGGKLLVELDSSQPSYVAQQDVCR
jgi:hypothetical protein